MVRGRAVQDPELAEACKLLGITLYEPPKPPARVGSVVDGHACLVFRSNVDRAKAVAACQQEVTDRCINGARPGCVIKAMDSCSPAPRWLRWLGLAGKAGSGADPTCQPRVMQECMNAAQVSCAAHAQQFCEAALPMQMCSPQPYPTDAAAGSNPRAS